MYDLGLRTAEVVLLAFAVFCGVHALVQLAEFRTDRINTIALCERVNALAVPELAAFALVMLSFALRMDAPAIAVGAPLGLFYLYLAIFSSDGLMLRPERVTQQQNLVRRVLETKLVFYIVLLFYALTSVITYLVRSLESASGFDVWDELQKLHFR